MIKIIKVKIFTYDINHILYFQTVIDMHTYKEQHRINKLIATATVVVN